VGFVRRHAKLFLSYAMLAGLGVFGGHELAMTANAQTDPHAFTITSSTVAGIAPGRPLSFLVTVTNPSSQAMHLLTLSTMVTLLADPPAPRGASPCDVSKLTVAPYNSAARGAAQYVLAARATSTVPLTITLADTQTNQDGCKSRKFTLTYSGTAEQVH
jgi:hypothetical protein